MIQRGFAGAVCRQERSAHLGGTGADVQDLAATARNGIGLLALHQPPGALGRQQRAVEVDGEYSPPRLKRKLEQRCDVEDAGVVDQDVQSVERVPGAGKKVVM